jgi:hypothetical protein
MVTEARSQPSAPRGSAHLLPVPRHQGTNAAIIQNSPELVEFVPRIDYIIRLPSASSDEQNSADRPLRCRTAVYPAATVRSGVACLHRLAAARLVVGAGEARFEKTAKRTQSHRRNPGESEMRAVRTNPTDWWRKGVIVAARDAIATGARAGLGKGANPFPALAPRVRHAPALSRRHARRALALPAHPQGAPGRAGGPGGGADCRCQSAGACAAGGHRTRSCCGTRVRGATGRTRAPLESLRFGPSEKSGGREHRAESRPCPAATSTAGARAGWGKGPQPLSGPGAGRTRHAD